MGREEDGRRVPGGGVAVEDRTKSRGTAKKEKGVNVKSANLGKLIVLTCVCWMDVGSAFV